MSTLKTHNLQSPDSGSANIALTANAGMIVTGISTFNDRIDIGSLGVTTNFTVAGISTFTGNIIANGSVGIGTTDPGFNSTLHIHGGSASSKNYIRLTADRGLIARLGDTSSGAQAMFDLYDTDGSTQIVRFISGGGVNYINTGGNVGINTNNPSAMLHVLRTNDSATTCIIANNGTTAADGLKITSGGTGSGTDILSVFRNNQSSEEEVFRVDAAGDVRVNVGNLVIATNNKGISFSGSTSSPDADSTSSTRVITDYDEGTCDWELHRSDGLTTGSNHTTSKVTYTKIGNRVYISGYVYTMSTGSTTGASIIARLTDASGNAASLPYTPNHTGILPICHTRTINEYSRMSVAFETGSKTVYVHHDEAFNSYNPTANNVSISSTQTHLVIAFTGSYTTNE